VVSFPHNNIEGAVHLFAVCILILIEAAKVKGGILHIRITIVKMNREDEPEPEPELATSEP